MAKLVSTANPYLQIRGVRKTFGSFVALEDINLDVLPGEFVCFLGPSGCGKTTLLRIVAGLEQADSGQILQSGDDVTTRAASERDFGIVFQSYALFPNLTAERNVAYGLESTRMPRDEIRKRVRDLLALVGLGEFGTQYPAQLSGGQQQRVALARALALSPGLLLLDEPLSALDARVRANLRREISLLQRKLGVTTIMVTHDQEEALTMGDRIVVMDQGRIVQVGTPHEVYTQPGSAFVANFVGITNLLNAQLARSPRGLAINGLVLPMPDGSDDLTHVPEGSHVTVAVRPEQIQVSRQNGDGRHPVRVVHSEFLGSYYRLTVQPLGAHALTLLADVPAAATEALYLTRVPDGAAAEVYVRIPAEAVRVFAGQGVEERSA